MKQTKHFDFGRFTLSIYSNGIMLGYYPNKFKGVSKSIHLLWNVPNRPFEIKFIKWGNNE